MSDHGKYRGRRNKQTLSSVARNTTASVSPNSPVLDMFKSLATKLNERQDRHERLVKLSRDITIESKRIIFLLHSGINAESTLKTVQEAKERIQKLINGPIKSIGLELEHSPAYLHTRAVTAGFQEFIEARTLCSVIDTKEIVSYPEVQMEFQYEIKEGDAEIRVVITMLPHLDYILGLADLTGELMRRVINSISSGDSEECFSSCQLVRDLYTCFIGVHGHGRHCGPLWRKAGEARASARKVEAAAYALTVRGGEAPPALLLRHTQPAAAPCSDDEGYY